MSNRVYPSLRYRDARAAQDFLERAFGLESQTTHENEDGSIGHAEMSWGESRVMFGQETEEGIARWGEHAGGGWLYLTVDDPDSLFARAKEAGAEVVMELTDQDYGSRDFTVRDPEGNLWSFGTYDPLD